MRPGCSRKRLAALTRRFYNGTRQLGGYAVTFPTRTFSRILLISALAVLVGASGAVASAPVCFKQKLVAARIAARKVANCRAQFAVRNDAGLATECRNRTLAKVAAKIARADTKVDRITSGFVCPGDVTTLEIDGMNEWLETTLSSSVFGANSLPNRCVSKRARAVGKYLNAYTNCWAKNFGADAGTIDACAAPALAKLTDQWDKADNKVACTSDDVPTVVAALDPEVDAQADLVLVECGDADASGLEACDDGNAVDGDGCDTNCTVSSCGNGIVTAPEECDDGNAVDGDGCDTNCTNTACGNGIATAGEACDDGNGTEGDGCDSNCTVSACGNGIDAPNEDCDDGNAVDGDGCDSNCTVTACGNGIVTAPEECDDANAVGGDGCENDCTITLLCGNGNPDPGEECDDGGNVNGDGCASTCKREECGLVMGSPVCILCPDGASPDATFSSCSCDAGYTDSGSSCDDIDECALATDDCPVGDPCVNVPGSYACAIDCTEAAFHTALAACGAPSGVITFDCMNTTIEITGDPNEPPNGPRDIECDGLVIDGLDRNITFDQNPFCFETVLTPGECEVPLNLDDTCDCPSIDGGSVFVDLEGNDNIVRNLTVRHFFDGITVTGSNNLVENVDFVRICDAAMQNGSTGVANEFRGITVDDGCDKCIEVVGDITATSAFPELTDHYNMIFRDVDITDCDQPFRATLDGRYLLDRVSMTGGLPSTNLFRCLGPRATTPNSGDLVIHMRDSLVDDCIRGLRIGAFAEAIIEDSTFVNNEVRGILVSNDARASLSGNVVTGNGGLGTSEPGTGGVTVTDAAEIDLGGGSLTIDGASVASSGGNTLCMNVAPNMDDRDAQNLTATAVKAENNWWCDLDPSDQVHENPGTIDTDPFLGAAP